jgi:pimeloyl-ACP methyl ester carboxylesterase
MDDMGIVPPALLEDLMDPITTTPRTLPEGVSSVPVYHRMAQVDGVNLFYREAGDPARPTVLLLHGFPASSHMFRQLLPLLADRYHLVAPDYPGFGNSDAPPVEAFEYSFDRFAQLIEGLTRKLGLERYAIYVQDYGAPVGYRLALAHPERITAIVVQNGNGYAEGLEGFWDPIRTLWNDPSTANRDKLRPFLGIEGTKWQYLTGVRDPERISPDTWLVDQPLLDRPGNQEIQLALFYDYRTNLDLYPRLQAWFRERKPPMLIVWGKNDPIFPASGATPYLRDLPEAELHLLDTGHFALEEDLYPIAALMRDFLGRTLG